MKVSEAYPGYLEAGDLDRKEVTVTIAGHRPSGKEDKGKDGRAIDKPILSFKGTKKELVLNKTNARTVRCLYGNDMANWTGKKVILYPTTCNAFGDPNTPCIRVKEINPETGKAPEAW